MQIIKNWFAWLAAVLLGPFKPAEIELSELEEKILIVLAEADGPLTHEQICAELRRRGW